MKYHVNDEIFKKKYIIKRRKRDNQIFTDYSQITTNENKIQIGDSVLLWCNGECYAVINRIYTLGHEPATVSITWYYTPKDIFEK